MVIECADKSVNVTFVDNAGRRAGTLSHLKVGAVSGAPNAPASAAVRQFGQARKFLFFFFSFRLTWQDKPPLMKRI